MATKISSSERENQRIGPSLLHKLAPTKFIRCVVEMLDDSYTEVDIEVCCYFQYCVCVY